MEQRIAKIESTLEQMDKTLDRIEREIAGGKVGMLEIRARVAGLRNRMDSMFRWTIVLAITMWVTIVLAILFKG